MSLSDDLVRIDMLVENMVRKIEKQYQEVAGDQEPLKVIFRFERIRTYSGRRSSMNSHASRVWQGRASIRPHYQCHALV